MLIILLCAARACTHAGSGRGQIVLASVTPYHRAAAQVREALGLRPRSYRARALRQRDQRWPALHGYSAHVLPRPADWRPGLEVVGYWPAPQPPGWTAPPDLVDFLDAGPSPVFIGFGSMASGQDGWLSEVVTGPCGAAGGGRWCRRGGPGEGAPARTS